MGGFVMGLGNSQEALGRKEGTCWVLDFRY